MLCPSDLSCDLQPQSWSFAKVEAPQPSWESQGLPRLRASIAGLQWQLEVRLPEATPVQSLCCTSGGPIHPRQWEALEIFSNFSAALESEALSRHIWRPMLALPTPANLSPVQASTSLFASSSTELILRQSTALILMDPQPVAIKDVMRRQRSSPRYRLTQETLNFMLKGKRLNSKTVSDDWNALQEEALQALAGLRGRMRISSFEAEHITLLATHVFLKKRARVIDDQVPSTGLQAMMRKAIRGLRLEDSYPHDEKRPIYTEHFKAKQPKRHLRAVQGLAEPGSDLQGKVLELQEAYFLPWAFTENPVRWIKGFAPDGKVQHRKAKRRGLREVEDESDGI